MVTPEFTPVNKDFEVKVLSRHIQAVELVALVADINYPATGCLFFKFLGERQERGYVAAGPAARQKYCHWFVIHWYSF